MACGYAISLCTEIKNIRFTTEMINIQVEISDFLHWLMLIPSYN